MTTEFALVLPVVVIVMGLALAALAWGGHRLQASDLASMAARTAAVEGDTSAHEAVSAAAPGAHLAVSRSGVWVTVTVSVESVSWLPTADARVTARAEP
ncbi:TadE family type IV pilus minor pilin [Demequina flava]|uniref:TadE family type IV pilus minor pilin n=1 Tax=Demequina flava TaxID=1095025 RepID=UPI00128E819E|nr:TadE family type IV pilus minor pilin [Demequina flava]